MLDPVSGDELAGDDDALHLVGALADHEQRRIGSGARPFANTEVIDREAAERVADRAGGLDPMTVARLATAAQRLEPWDDSIVGLTRMARRFAVLGLSNAGRTTLLRLNAHAGLLWHQALSAEDADAYKPAPEVYQLAIAATGSPPDRVLMVAAHAWDLRGAQAIGMRTAYVERPVGDPPTGNDTFDGHFNNLEARASALNA
jgi:2-haloacid dehalogenase